jgi:hypothetical protein
VICLNCKKIRKGEVISPWRRKFHELKSPIPSFSKFKDETEYVMGLIPVKIPFIKPCKHACGKQTFREDGECIHCYYHMKFFNKPSPGAKSRAILVLMMNKREDNEFGKLPKHLVVYFIKEYL